MGIDNAHFCKQFRRLFNVMHYKQHKSSSRHSTKQKKVMNLRSQSGFAFINILNRAWLGLHKLDFKIILF